MSEKIAKNIKIISLILSVLVFLLLLTFFFVTKNLLNKKNYLAPKNFKECLVGQNIIREIYPRQCVDKRGQIFTEDIGNELQKKDLIQIINPRPNSQVGSPLNISGQARGNWFFEASFPIILIDENNNILASGIATAEEDWMTEDFVSFKAQLNFSVSTPTAAFLILKKDNPSGLAANDDYLRIPVDILPMK